MQVTCVLLRVSREFSAQGRGSVAETAGMGARDDAPDSEENQSLLPLLLWLREAADPRCLLQRQLQVWSGNWKAIPVAICSWLLPLGQTSFSLLTQATHIHYSKAKIQGRKRIITPTHYLEKITFDPVLHSLPDFDLREKTEQFKVGSANSFMKK